MPRPKRMYTDKTTSAVDGKVVWAPVKSLWFTSMAVVGLAGCVATASWDAFLMSAVLTAVTLCMGHSVGMHRLLIHRSFACPRWLEYVLVSLGTLVGMGGPRRMMLMHESRDWAQNQLTCHPFFTHRSGILKDAWWNLHCECRLRRGPEFRPEEALTESRFYQLLDRYWMATQLPLAVVLYVAGGWPWVVWGICGRVPLSLIGHWLVGYLAHNTGQQTWHVNGASVQGFNLPGLGVLTMGESWHNNHHAFPDSARLGIGPKQLDPGWWLIAGLRRLGLAWDVTLPEQIEHRHNLMLIGGDASMSRKAAAEDRRSEEPAIAAVSAGVSRGHIPD